MCHTWICEGEVKNGDSAEDAGHNGDGGDQGGEPLVPGQDGHQVTLGDQHHPVDEVDNSVGGLHVRLDNLLSIDGDGALKGEENY